ncbi:MAG: hypothetical protein OXG35_11780 [Acidobacteria bacterium]|nr:hypothetical protein [Acidobacteriota bacterium]
MTRSRFTAEQAAKAIGPDSSPCLRELALALYPQPAEHAESRSIIVADTKFESRCCGPTDGRTRAKTPSRPRRSS